MSKRKRRPSSTPSDQTRRSDSNTPPPRRGPAGWFSAWWSNPPRGLIDQYGRVCQLIALPHWTWSKTVQLAIFTLVFVGPIAAAPSVTTMFVLHGDAVVDALIR
ncbi:hypothetical protein FEK35_29215 [Nocardia cyriacigeorgica]|uniref:Uncharacterized protein n=1 Tax=Nocardia cyriacigeorgica TaxID=135487 RepID=A0A5R8P540_9NOCA|nr:hypothetical protein [Nocardia cyriacigeorgica]TLF93656.1 hypothetical protein FEK35_29215 [Nocardia cyriacigeorgica]